MKKFYTIILFALIAINGNSQAPNWTWAKSAIGGGAAAFGISITIDANGNSYVTGRFDSTMTFGSAILNSVGQDIFVAKYDPSGNVIWATSATGIGDGGVNAISVDLNGNVFITGYFGGATLTFGSTVLTNGGTGTAQDIFIAKYNTSGTLLWAHNPVGTGNIGAIDICTDALGNSYITGSFYSPIVTFGTFTLSISNGGVYFVKYDPSGNVLLAVNSGGAGSDGDGYGIVSDASGNIYVAGNFQSNITFGSTILTNLGSIDIFITKFDSGGNLVWAKSAGGAAEEDVYGMSIDSAGNTYLTGFFLSTTLAFGLTSPLTNAGGQDIFIAKYDPSGTAVWAKSAGGTGDEEGRGINIGHDGNVSITGFYNSSSMTFSSNTITNNGGNDIFVTKYNSSTGIVIWSVGVGNTGVEIAFGISTDINGDTYITGGFSSPTFFLGSTSLANDGGFDFFIAKMGNTTGISENILNEGISIYPNPSAGLLTIKYSEYTTPDTKYEIEIYNVLGKKIYYAQINSDKAVIDLNKQPNGIYIYQIKSEKEILKTGKIIIE